MLLMPVNAFIVWMAAVCQDAQQNLNILEIKIICSFL